MLKGNLGQPHGGWPEAIQKKVLKGEAPLDHPPRRGPAAGRPRGDARQAGGRPRLGREETAGETVDDEDLNGYLMYPKVFMDYRQRHRMYGPVRTMPTRTFFYGMEPGEEITAEIDPGQDAGKSAFRPWAS